MALTRVSACVQQCMNKRWCNWILRFSCETLAQSSSIWEARLQLQYFCFWYLTSVAVWKWKSGNCSVSALQKLHTFKKRYQLLSIFKNDELPKDPYFFFAVLQWFWYSHRLWRQSRWKSKICENCGYNFIAGHWQYMGGGKKDCVSLCTYCMNECTEQE